MNKFLDILYFVSNEEFNAHFARRSYQIKGLKKAYFLPVLVKKVSKVDCQERTKELAVVLSWRPSDRKKQSQNS